MCINKLGIALDGYGDGAVVLFRGTEMKHYISQWTGSYRYAFDHTTHQLVEDAVREHDRTGRWGPSKDSRRSKDRKGATKSKKPDDEDDGNPGGGNASGKPQGNTKKRPRDDDGEGQPDEDPAPRKKAKTSAVKGKGQVRAVEQKSDRVQKIESNNKLPEKPKVAKYSKRGTRQKQRDD